MFYKIKWINNRVNTLLAAFIDFILILFCFYETHHSNQIFFICSLLIWILGSYISGRYSKENNKIFEIIFKQLINLVLVILIYVIPVTLYYFIFNKNLISYSSQFDLYIFFTTSFILQIIIKLTNKVRDLRTQNWVLISSEECYKSLLNHIKKDRLDFNLILVNELNEIENNFSNNIKGVIVEKYGSISNKQLNQLFDFRKRGLEILNVTEWFEIYFQRIPTKFLSNEESIKLCKFKSKSFFEYRFKRAFDLIISLFLLFVLSPVILLSCILLIIDDGFPIIYRQKRNGLNGKIFLIFKIRTMKNDAEKDGVQWSSRNDSRITFIGKYLRFLRIDELPQLVNVIKGEMSLIGPRPERPEIEKVLLKEIPFYKLRSNQLPGISGWAQVNFPYGASINDSKIKLSYDLFYYKNFSIWLDLLIVLKTLKTVLASNKSVPKN